MTHHGDYLKKKGATAMGSSHRYPNGSQAT